MESIRSEEEHSRSKLTHSKLELARISYNKVAKDLRGQVPNNILRDIVPYISKDAEDFGEYRPITFPTRKIVNKTAKGLVFKNDEEKLHKTIEHLTVDLQSNP